jgi:glutathione peroxidase
MKLILSTIITLLTFLTFAQDNIYSFSFKDINERTVSFSKFKGKKILIVNTASECGFTPQYQELQELHEQYGDQLVIIGFPANNFGKQEPGTDSDIATFCKKNYGVTFIMASKVSVKGKFIDPLFSWLINQKNKSYKGPIYWNFEKFLIDENGKVSSRYRSKVKPMDSEIIDEL